jgi:hypothetical protein
VVENKIYRGGGNTMKTSVVWLFSNGAREFNIHEVNPELFDKLRPAFDTPEQCDVGKITVDKDTTIVFTRSKTKKDETIHENRL